MEVTSTIEINGEEREIADAYAREQCAKNAKNIATNAEGIASLNNNLSQLEIDLKMLGYTVPKEMTVQNYVDSDGVFHQRVGRVDLGSLNYVYQSDFNRFVAYIPDKIIPSSNTEWTRGLYCSIYKPSASPITSSREDMTITGYNGEDVIFINNFSYTDATSFKNAMQGVYLYYELATGHTISVDGNEAVTKVNDSLSVIGKCKNLLNPTLATTTENGVTCTNNGDGTFTLNGTATAITQFKLMDLNKAYAKKVKLLGTPKNGGNTNFYVYFITSDGIRSDLNNGRFIDSNITINNLCLWVNNGIVCKNVIFKPMLTTNLNATYDDFVPYTGDGETLTADVAELKSDLVCKSVTISSDITKNIWTNNVFDLPAPTDRALYTILVGATFGSAQTRVDNGSVQIATNIDIPSGSTVYVSGINR